METLQTIILIVLAPFGWMAISKIESNFFVLTSISNWFLWWLVLKPILSMVIGPIAAPFYIIGYLMRRPAEKKSEGA
ncbi:MAG: hypothetical protein KGZ64_10985 [Thermaerobacter sp.]|nr:hypothetical protein [Thermaerobacter sp.]